MSEVRSLFPYAGRLGAPEECGYECVHACPTVANLTAKWLAPGTSLPGSYAAPIERILQRHRKEDPKSYDNPRYEQQGGLVNSPALEQVLARAK